MSGRERIALIPSNTKARVLDIRTPWVFVRIGSDAGWLNFRDIWVVEEYDPRKH